METKTYYTKGFDGKTTMQLEERSKAKTISILREGVSKLSHSHKYPATFWQCRFQN